MRKTKKRPEVYDVVVNDVSKVLKRRYPKSYYQTVIRGEYSPTIETLYDDGAFFVFAGYYEYQFFMNQDKWDFVDDRERKEQEKKYAKGVRKAIITAKKERAEMIKEMRSH